MEYAAGSMTLAWGLRGEGPKEKNHPFTMETDKKDPQSLCLPDKHASQFSDSSEFCFVIPRELVQTVPGSVVTHEDVWRKACDLKVTGLLTPSLI